MTFISRADCPPAYNGCTCQCHRHPGCVHFMACCRPAFSALTRPTPTVDRQLQVLGILEMADQSVYGLEHEWYLDIDWMTLK